MKCLILSKIIITTWTFALCCIPRWRLGSLHLPNDSQSSPSCFYPQRWGMSPSPGIIMYVTWVIWCSGKNCHKAQPWWIPTISWSMMGTRWRASLSESKDRECRSQGKLRAEDNSANRLWQHSGTWILKPANFLKISLSSSKPICFYANQEIEGEGNTAIYCSPIHSS